MGDTASATAIPKEINLSLQKPVATPAYTRRFKSQASNPTAIAGSQVQITLDTAQPGSFIDTLSSYLSFDLEIVNSSTTNGYNVAFSSCGAHALFRAMRIYVQGVPIEEITEYNALAEFLHDLAGIPDYSDMSSKTRYLSNTLKGDMYIYVPPSSSRTIDIQLPLISGVLGTMADKMFPSMLVAPGNCYIQLDMATAAHAFRVQEVDVRYLAVGTAPLPGNSTTAADTAPDYFGPAQSTLSVANGDASKFKITTPAVTHAQNSCYDTDLVATATSGLNAATILENGPFDCPYRIGDATSVNRGILTTEERIGGGMFWNNASTAYAGSGATEQLHTSNVVSRYPQNIFGNGDAGIVGDNTLITNTATNDALTSPITTINSSTFMPGGLKANGTSSGTAPYRMTQSASINITYKINNMEYVGKQIVVGDDVARAIIERAASGDISIHTQSYRQYGTSIPLTSFRYEADPAYENVYTSGVIRDGLPLCNLFRRVAQPGNQSVIIPAKISSANAIYHLFRNGQSENDFRFDSLRRIAIGMTDDASSTVTAQLRIGNELIPQSPIQKSSEALAELLKAHHMDGYVGTTEKFGSIVAASTANTYYYLSGSNLPLKRGSTYNPRVLSASAVPVIGRDMGFDPDGSSTQAYGGIKYLRNDFNSNILCPDPSSVAFRFPTFHNYYSAATAAAPGTSAAPTGFGGRNFFRPLGPSSYQVSDGAATAVVTTSASDFYDTSSEGVQKYMFSNLATTGVYPESLTDYQRRIQKWKSAVRRAFFGYADDRTDHQLTHPEKPNFMNPFKQHTGCYSTFALGFDLDTFSHNSDTIRSGHYLGNNTVSLNLSNMVVVDNSPMNMPLMNSVKLDTFVLHDVRLSFQAGGILQAFY